MIKSLRKQFVIVAMCSTFAVLAAIMGAINIANYNRIVDKADAIIQLLVKNNGEFAVFQEEKTVEGPDKKENRNERNRRRHDVMSPETPFSTRYFTVTLNAEGNVVSSNMGKIAAIDEAEAEEYATQVFEKGKDTGFEGIYRYNLTETEDEIMIVFLDCNQDIENVKGFAITSVAVSVAGLLAVFILVVVFSKMVFKPVEESYEKQKRFITDASHEIKTPLTIIDANTEVMEMESGESQWTVSTRNQIKRLSYLINQMVVLSKMDEGNGVNVKNLFSLSEIVAKSVEPFEAMARTQGKNLCRDIEDGINLYGDENSITQLVGILMDNAVKYSIPDEDIQVSLKRKGKKVQLEVLNKTESIPKGNLNVLFERFYRTDSSRNSETGGSGIGLSIAYSIVKAHKGKISAFSEDGKSLKISAEFKI